MIQATYLDSSGSMVNLDRSTITFEGDNHTFSCEVDSDLHGGTAFEPVFTHARAAGYTSIRVVTDGFGEFDARNSDQRPVFSDLEIDWVIVS